ncbi:hypothetical protein CTI12_AA439420 [Artemisia annua]|uniref:Membrane protein of ER body-like protein n=1 Tax=Artemisia annua TaxID=35608 RepID=A0A2U1LYG6_ARTAN|nr:hypothetical protein CTI12_AA439420 [Artemisia annua]
MADAVMEQWQPEGEEGSDAGLKDSAMSDVFPSNGIASIVSTKELDKNEDILKFDGSAKVESLDAGLKDTATSDVFPSNGIASIVSSKELDKNEDSSSSSSSDSYVSDIVKFDDIGSAKVEGLDAGLKEIATSDVFPSNGIASIVRPKELDENEDSSSDSSSSSDSYVSYKFDGIGSAKVDGATNAKNEIVPTQKDLEETSGIDGELLEEEIVELEFEKVKPKLETHSMHCPNCKFEVTKVILRQKVYQSVREPSVPVAPQPEPQEDLVGCLTCLSLFSCSENGCFNPFDILRKRTPTSADSTPSPPKDNVVVDENGTVTVGNIKGTTNGLIDATRPSFDLPESSNPGGVDTAITIENEQKPTPLVIAPPSERPWLGQDGLLLEILKSIVYGGLMEVIASLSVVASAAASDASTLSIVALALATLIGGVFIIGHNLWDLRDDCYKESSNQQKYKELLGEISYFPLHAFFAILSFLVFGIVPPVAYGYVFHATNDKDYTLVVVSIASLLCVALLAIFKAYINKCTVFDYFKTVAYYIATAVSVSGVSYVVGNLVARLMEEYGLFDTSSNGGMSLLTQATTSSFASF